MRTFHAIAIAGTLLATTPALAADLDWGKVDQALGKAGTDRPAGVHKYGLTRTDLHVTLDGVVVKPTLALGGWLAFKEAGPGQAMVMGDLVLTETEVNPVTQRLIASGIEITAIHNHLLRAQPATFCMHVLGHGDAVKLAAVLHDGLAESKTPLTAPAGTGSQPPPSAQALDLDTEMIDRTLGAHGQVAGGVYQVSIPRADPVRDDGMEIPDTMGTAEAINFQPTGGGKAAITGDFVLTATEVTPVLRALGENGIEVTALHNHMLDDEPRLFFMHFWANADAAKLAQGLRAALDRVDVKKS
jgi:hypothetical protein